MHIGVVLGYLRSRLQAFIGSERGNVMFTFALATHTDNRVCRRGRRL